MTAARSSIRFFRPLLYVTGAAIAGGGILYVSYRPRNLPGSEPAAVPPPGYGEGGKFIPPRFPRVKSREEQIANLKQSAGIRNTVQRSIGAFQSLPATDGVIAEQTEAEPYDLLVIGGGATGTGIALDAATRGLKVAVVERDDFSSGTSSKSTKLVHGGVRYLEKAVWELDYSQYVDATSISMSREAYAVQVQTGKGGFEGEKIFFGHGAPSLNVATYHDSHSKLVASTVFLGRHQVL